MKYFFILGKNPILSKAEIEAVLQSKVIKSKVEMSFDKILILEIDKELDVEWLNSQLGGTVKIGLILGEMSDVAEFEEKFFEFAKFNEKKFYFGFSLYPLSPKINILAIQKKVNAIAMELKSRLRDEKQVSSRYVVSREAELSSVIVQKNKLLKNGAEFCFFIDQGKTLFGQTLAVQEFEQFGARDFARPGRDNVSGMLPPKLARMMINLAQVKSDATILDPFCGSGTILQEAIVLGYKNLTGTDNSDRAVKDSLNNLEWLLNKSKVKSLKSNVMKLDVKDLSLKFKANSIDAIVTEPFLGPAMRGNENQVQLEKIIESLESIYLAAFVQFAKVLVKGGKVVMVFPIYNIRNIQNKLDILSQIEKLGFVKSNKEELVYFRENQYVRRSIMIFKKV
ncbi:MAG: RsmD family RNA methyltransferase [Candidatus Parcubacteria bacterium]|nr:RsmD family RNA methyltransferase [Candidatus Parcubacteria bacterium]